MAGDRPQVSAVVISYNGMRFLPDCMRTLVDDLAPVSHEIIVIDNGSSDGSADFVADSFPDVRLIRNESNRGFAPAVNQGLSSASGEFVYLLNQDLRFPRGTITKLLDRIRRDKSIGLVGPAFVGFDGVLQKSARAFPTFRHVFYKAFFLDRLFPRHREFSSWKMGWFDHRTEMFVDQPMGAVMLMPMEVVKKVGLFDEIFPLVFNDVDYCRRIHAAGLKCLYYPGAEVEHYVGGSTSRIPYRLIVASHSSFYRYLGKYARWYQYPLLWISGVLLLEGMLVKLALAAVGIRSDRRNQ